MVGQQEILQDGILGSQFGPHLTIGWFKKYNYGTRAVVCIQAGHTNTSNIDLLVER
jgi:hypothetical protein